MKQDPFGCPFFGLGTQNCQRAHFRSKKWDPKDQSQRATLKLKLQVELNIKLRVISWSECHILVFDFFLSKKEY